MNSIQKLYKTIFDIAIQVQLITRKNDKIKGKDIWQRIESELKTVDFNILEINMLYNESLKIIYENMNQIENFVDIVNNEYNPVYNHFFLQLKNLVEKKSNFIVQLYRVGQLAYNAGQLSVFLDEDNINSKIKEFVLKNNMLDINTYITIENQNIIDTAFSHNLINIDNIINNILKIGNEINMLSQSGGLLNKNTYDNNYYLQKYLKYKQKYLNLNLK